MDKSSKAYVCRDAALAWEKAFIQLAQTRLQDLAAQANLKLSFSSERSVEDELARETASDSVTVAVSYLVMLLYIALALGTLPAGSSSWAVLVYSRVGVGLTGVMIVGLSVLAALGLCSLFGMWATLIILEVTTILVCLHVMSLEAMHVRFGFPHGTHPCILCLYTRRTSILCFLCFLYEILRCLSLSCMKLSL